jgi:cytochrome c biogenesis protein CcmG, thiol:disulfide interchange protein DsbE
MTAEARRQRSVLRLVSRAVGIGLLAAFLGLLVYGLVARAPDRTIDDALLRAETVVAPGFELAVLHQGRAPGALGATLKRVSADRRIGLAELRGTPVVLNFWASWCDPCRAEAPVLEAGWRTARGQGVLFLGLDMQDNPDDAREFLREFDITYPNIREGGKQTYRKYGLTGLPETFFISDRGQIVSHVIGVITPDQLRRGVAAAAAGRPQATAQGGDQREAR